MKEIRVLEGRLGSRREVMVEGEAVTAEDGQRQAERELARHGQVVA